MNNEILLVLHRHWIWADLIKLNFETEVKKTSVKSLNLTDKAYIYMLLWYGLLFGIIDALKGYEIVLCEIKNDIDDLYANLKDLRNAIFHPQPKYWSSKILKFISSKYSVRKIRKIHDYLGEYFLEEMNKRSNNEL